MAPPAARPKPSDYFAVHDRVTRHGQLTESFDSVMTVDATLSTPEFRAAYAERYIQLYNVPESERDRVREQIMTEAADSIELHLETATHAFDANDLTSNKTMWRITLIDDQGREIQPSDLVPARGHRTTQRAFYSNANDFSKGWRLRFPRQRPDGEPALSPGSRSLTLRMGSPHGAIDLTWRLSTPGG